MGTLRMFIVITSVVLFLVGCQTDKNEAENIQDKMNQAAAYEEDFQSNQESLETQRDEEQAIYEDIIAGDIQDKENILEQVDEGKASLKKQSQLVEEGQAYFQQAYEEASSIESNVEQIEDKQQQDQALKLLDVIKERKEEIKNYFDLYQDQLNELNTFYEALESEEISLDDMSQQIDEVNEKNEEMEEHLQSFNKATETYNEEETTYYETVEKS